MILTYREHAKPHARGIALLGLSGIDPAHHQREKLVAWNSANRLLSAGRFFWDTESSWACSSPDKPKPGIPLNNVVHFKQVETEPELLSVKSPQAGSSKTEDVCINMLLTPAQMQFCLRLYLDGGSDAIKLIRGFEVEDEILALLHLEKKEVAWKGDRKMSDLIGIYDRHGTEVQLLECSRGGHVQFYVGFAKGEKGMDQVRAYSEGTPLDFFEDCPRIALKELLGGA